MDHLPAPSDPLYPDLIVPCLCDTPYDQLDFQDYPFRRGWDATRLRAGYFDQHSPESTAAFLQNWLYFGLLHQLLGASRSDYIHENPSTSHGCVTTKNLSRDVLSQLGRLSDRLDYGRGPQDVVDRARTWLQDAEVAIKTLHYFCELFDSMRRNGQANPLPIQPEVDLSFRVLGVSLSAMCSDMSIRLGQAHSNLFGVAFRGSLLAESRMKLANWCPSEIERAAAEFSSPSIHYISTMRRAETGRSHDACTSTKCQAFFTDPAIYETQHAVPHCQCSEILPDIAAIVALIHAGKIPLLTIALDDSDTPLITVEAYKPGMEYVAISHVWADGMGNTKQNALPACQFVRLKNILAELNESESILSTLNSFRVSALIRRQQKISVRFWCDTICIPLESADVPARKAAIMTMKHVYQNAYQILVLDKELAETDHVSILETFMRCSLSGWMRRLWTLQEAVLGNRLFVKFRNQIVDVQDCYQVLTDPPKRNDPRAEERKPLDRFYGSPSLDCLQFYHRMRGMRDYLHAPEQRKLTHLIKSKRFENAETKAWDDARGTMRAFEASRYRTTSKKEDVYLCLGNLLGYNEGLSKIPVDQRMRTILAHKSTLPHGLLFVPGPRIDYPGWRWGVRDFETDDQSLMTGDIDDGRPAKMTSRGLVVSYPGLILPQMIKLDSPTEVVMAVCTDSNGSSRAWWKFKFLPIDSTTVEVLAAGNGHSSQSRSHCILFHSKDEIMQAGNHMAAALVELDIADVAKVTDNSHEVSCQFLRLVVAEYVGGDVDLHILKQRRDIRLHVQAEGFAWMVWRDWTLG